MKIRRYLKRVLEYEFTDEKTRVEGITCINDQVNQVD
jgi:hypothetical protein